MPLAPLEVPGLSRPLMLPSEVDAKVAIINHERFRSFRKFTGQSLTTVHDTGNPNTNAIGEYEWAAAGRQGAGVGGYNAIADGIRLFITQPFDEIVWHAGTPNGNQSYGVEMAYGKNQNYDKVLGVNTALHGAILAAKGLSGDDAVLHQHWYGKWCAATILNKNIWWQVQTAIETAYAAALEAYDDTVPQVPVYPKPSLIPSLEAALKAVANPEDPALTVAPRSVFDQSIQTRFFWVGDRVKATVATPRLRFAFTDAARLGVDIKAGEEFDVNWLFIGEDGREYYLTPWYTRVRAEDTVRVSDLKQEP
jgi:hypothetical protein